jgi:hypothetical protein
VDLDHGGDPGPQQPGGAQQRVEMDIARAQAGVHEDPGLQQEIRKALLEGCGPGAVVMGVDQAGHDRDPIGAEHLDMAVAGAQVGPGAGFHDPLALDQHGAVVDHGLAVGDHPAPADQLSLALLFQAATSKVWNLWSGLSWYSAHPPPGWRTIS